MPPQIPQDPYDQPPTQPAAASPDTKLIHSADTDATAALVLGATTSVMVVASWALRTLFKFSISDVGTTFFIGTFLPIMLVLVSNFLGVIAIRCGTRALRGGTTRKSQAILGLGASAIPLAIQLIALRQA